MNKVNYHFNDWDYQLIISYKGTLDVKTVERSTIEQLDELVAEGTHLKVSSGWVIRDRKGKFIKKS